MGSSASRSGSSRAVRRAGVDVRGGLTGPITLHWRDNVRGRRGGGLPMSGQTAGGTARVRASAHDSFARIVTSASSLIRSRPRTRRGASAQWCLSRPNSRSTAERPIALRRMDVEKKGRGSDGALVRATRPRVWSEPPRAGGPSEVLPARRTAKQRPTGLRLSVAPIIRKRSSGWWRTA
jgi:hypothetical protein